MVQGSGFKVQGSGFRVQGAGKKTLHGSRRNHARFQIFFSFTLVTGPRRSLSLTPSDKRVYEPQIRAIPDRNASTRQSFGWRGTQECRKEEASHQASRSTLEQARALAPPFLLDLVSGLCYQFCHNRFYQLAADNLPISSIRYHPPADNTTLSGVNARIRLQSGSGWRRCGDIPKNFLASETCSAE